MKRDGSWGLAAATAVALAWALAACAGGEERSPSPALRLERASGELTAVAESGEDEPAIPRLGTGRTLIVNPGESIQAAVDGASPGDTIQVRPGTYREAGRPCPTDGSRTCAVVVESDDLQLVGEGGLTGAGGGPVLEAGAGQDQGIAFARSGARGATCFGDPAQRLRGAAVEGFTVRGFAGEGIFLLCVDEWRVERNVTEGNGEYGIFPSHSGRGRISHNVARGSNDTGIYVGQSHDVRIDHNLAEDNVSGFEIENSSRIRLDHNVASGNTGGILTFTLPHLHVNRNEDNVVEDNVVSANNRPNTCVHPGDTVCIVPAGTGILALASQRNHVVNNEVTGNATAGMALFDFCTATGLAPDACGALGMDPVPNGNRFDGNTVLGNGAAPDTARLPAGVPGGDVLWSGLGAGNCWKNLRAETVISPVPLPECP